MALGWIDNSKSEKNKVLSVMELLSEKGTLDELGIAPVRDGFANLFFPGNTTIQTRAKYFLIVPYAFKTIESGKETNPDRMQRQLEEIEKSCCLCFLDKNSTEEGVIGSNTIRHGGWVRRSPSDIYWAGLKRYRIFDGLNLSISQYIDAISKMKKEKSNTLKLGNRNDNSEADGDDKNAELSLKYNFWHIPTYKSDWQDDLKIELTEEEAAMLYNSIRETCSGSMLEFILTNKNTDILLINRFQDLQNIKSIFPEEMQTDYDLAYQFAEFEYVLQIVYNMIASDGNNERANDEWEMLRPELGEIADVDIVKIMTRLLIYDPRLKTFLIESKKAMGNGDLDRLKTLITDREVTLKGVNRAKTKKPSSEYADSWFCGDKLGYRFSNIKRIIRDIFEGMGVC